MSFKVILTTILIVVSRFLFDLKIRSFRAPVLPSVIRQPTLPDPEKIKQTLARAHRSCQEMELAGIQLEEIIVKLEQDNLTRRKQQLGKVLQQGQG